MLVLSRKKNQGIMLGDDIKIAVLEIKDDIVKIGIEAPRCVTILRSELYQAVREENTTAVASDGNVVELLKDFFAGQGKKG
ncbi:carbon storage regulator CsrA [Desulfallas thermosapovorans]|uniref:Translational regulator CsrA n=1 Tax=Desulfallas thermosapovorans DSM 6562 TaxID=1121431 RepID=A0A5S4ZRQ6_9FIRM|nr:carbon storage regulator CsrA [Desulfallas thermosapovorans]TYO95526.1 carbon storage regulator CsrA [Desulfallas thermosapovorans DSM 6562]